MALKGLSHRHETTMKYVLDRAAEPGTVVVASGVDGRVAIVGAEEVSASGIHPMGLLLNTREEFNYAKELERVQYDTDDIGTVVTLLRDGELNTNLLVENGGVSIANGQPAYLAPDGKAGNANLSLLGDDSQKLGQWMSSVDSDGFAILRVDLV